MDQATQTMIDNLQKNTGKSLSEWIRIVQDKNFEKHGQIMQFLKDEHGFTHGFGNLVAHKAMGTDADSVDDKDDLVTQQYEGKEHFLTLYESLLAEIKTFGDDVEVAPKKAYVSLRRKKQFAILQPATKTRFEIQLNLKGQEPTGRLEAIKAANAMCTHKINIAHFAEADKEVRDWIRTAYDMAG